VVSKVYGKAIEEVGSNITKRFNRIKFRIKTITYGKNKEFSFHKAIDQLLGSMVYFIYTSTSQLT
jgi:IS30 family transposase